MDETWARIAGRILGTAIVISECVVRFVYFFSGDWRLDFNLKVKFLT